MQTGHGTPLRVSHFVSFPPDDTVIAAGVAARKCTLFLQQLLVTSANSARGFTFYKVGSLTPFSEWTRRQ